MSLPKPYYEKDGITIYCADSFHTLLALAEEGVRVDMVATDPPYSSGGAFRGDRTPGVATKYVSTGTFADRPDYGGDSRDQRGYLAWSTLWLGAAYELARPGAIIATFTDWRQLPITTDAVQAGGWVWRGIFTWDKTEGSRPRLGGYRSQCEYAVWGSAGPMPDEGVAGKGLWRGTAPKGDRLHQAQKPVDLMHELLRVCREGGTVIDPFCGSGSTLVAAQALGLQAIGIEISPEHCETAVKRLRQKTIAWPVDAGAGGG